MKTSNGIQTQRECKCNPKRDCACGHRVLIDYK